MIEKYYKHIEKMEYDLRFQAFLNKVINMGNLLYPRDQHLFQLMGGVVFKDLETAMVNTIIDFSNASNDNQI